MARPQEAVQRYQRSGSSSCAVCDPLRPLHNDGTLFGLVFFDFTMHKSSASDGRRWSSEKLRHFACSSHDALLTRPQTRLGLHVSKCRASGACCLVNRACLDSCNKDQLIHDSHHTSNVQSRLLQSAHMTAAPSEFRVTATPLEHGNTK
jgi:hypothetical protein